MRTRLLLCAASIGLVAVVLACSTFENNPSTTPPGEDASAGDVIIGQTDESFTIVEAKQKVSIVQGQSAKMTLSITRTPALQQKSLPIELGLVDPPAGVTLEPAKIDPTSASVEVTLEAAAVAKQGDVALRFEGTVVGTRIKATRDVPLLVRGPTGSIDTTFATDGFQKAVFGIGPNALGHDTFATADGRVVVIAETTNFSGMGIARLDANGKLDPTFGDAGRLMFDQITVPGARTVAPDGTVYVIGYHDVVGETRFCRITPAGKPDTALSATGCVVFNEPGGAMQLAPDGNIIVGGMDINSATQITKVTTSGAIVTTFGTQGKTTVAKPLGRMLVRPDGRVLVTSRKTTTSAEAFQLTAAGVVDPSFTPPQLSPVQDYPAVIDAFLQPDGRFVLSYGRGDRTLLAGYKPNGESDPAFVGSGFPGVEGLTLLGALARTASGQIAFMTCSAQKFYRVDDKGLPDPALPSTGLPLTIEPDPADAGIDPVKPCGLLVPVADDRFVMTWTRKVGTPDKYDIYATRIWN